MKRNKHKHPQRPAASIDGIVTSSGRLGQVPHSYQPSRGNETPSLGDFIRRSDGFHPVRQSGAKIGHTPEQEEAERLDDDPIILDETPSKKDGKHEKKAKHPRLRKFFKRTALILGILFVLVGGFLTYKFNHSLSKVFHGNIFSILHSTKLKGEDQGRVTILLAGNSADDPGHSGGQLTDSIMLVSLNTKNNTGYLLSIPRDLWVTYPTKNCQFGNSGKINATYECGQMSNFTASGYPDGGMGALEKVVNQDFGVNINYYALVNYSALRDAVDAVGGVPFTVNVTDGCGKLYDGNRDYKTHGPLVNLTNGTHVLNGQQALDLSRARGDPPYPSCGFERGDFTRTQNQRQLLLNLKSKVFSLGTLGNPIKISSLLDTLGNNVQTDFHVDEVKRLYDLTKNIPNNQLQSIGLADSNVNLVRTGNVGDQSVVIPTAGVGNFSKIQTYLQRVSSNDQVVKEGASVVVLNGSDSIGLATKVSAGLTDRGINVVSMGDAATTAKTVVVALNSSNPATQAYLLKKFGLTSAASTTTYPSAKYYTADFVIILGNDAAGN